MSFFFSSRRRHTRSLCDWSSDVCSSDLSFGDRQMIGTSAEMKVLDADINRAARSGHVVLIIGESGTGKTTAAALIHRRSPRSEERRVGKECRSRLWPV